MPLPLVCPSLASIKSDTSSLNSTPDYDYTKSLELRTYGLNSNTREILIPSGKGKDIAAKIKVSSSGKGASSEGVNVEVVEGKLEGWKVVAF